MYGKNSGTCNVHVAKVYSTTGNKVALLPHSHILPETGVADCLK